MGGVERERKREKAPNKNTNRNKVGFAFDKHRKKAQRKVITYTTACPDYGLRLFLPLSLFSLSLPVTRLENTSFAVAQIEKPSECRRDLLSAGELRDWRWL